MFFKFYTRFVYKLSKIYRQLGISFYHLSKRCHPQENSMCPINFTLKNQPKKKAYCMLDHSVNVRWREWSSALERPLLAYYDYTIVLRIIDPLIFFVHTGWCWPELVLPHDVLSPTLWIWNFITILHLNNCKVLFETLLRCNHAV